MIINIVRKPLIGSVCENITLHNIGGLNIGDTRIGSEKITVNTGRFPANFICEKLVEPILDKQSLDGGMHSAGVSRVATRTAGKKGMFPMDGDGHRFGDSGGASRFFKVVEE